MNSPCEAQFDPASAQIASAEGWVLDRERRLVAYGPQTGFVRLLSVPRA